MWQAALAPPVVAGAASAHPYVQDFALGYQFKAFAQHSLIDLQIPNYVNAPHHASRLAEADRELLASRGTDRESAALAAFESAKIAARRSLREAQRMAKEKARISRPWCSDSS